MRTSVTLSPKPAGGKEVDVIAPRVSVIIWIDQCPLSFRLARKNGLQWLRKSGASCRSWSRVTPKAAQLESRKLSTGRLSLQTLLGFSSRTNRRTSSTS